LIHLTIKENEAMNPKISIIVPVYKVESYLKKCIGSILAQTFTDFELILVNDGSPDNSGEICEQYVQRDNRVIVIHKGNGGASSARNAGLEIARGQYIGFIDSDDYIHKKMFEILFVNAIKHSSDLVICEFLKVKENQPYNNEIEEGDYKIKHFTNIESLNQLFSKQPGDIMTGAGNNVQWVIPCNKLFKRSLFEMLEFEDGRICEDEFIIHKILYKTKKVTYVLCQLYYYVQRPNSVMRSKFSLKRLDKVYALKERADFFLTIKEKKLHDKAIKSYVDAFFWNYFKAKDELGNVESELKQLKRAFDKSVLFLMKNQLIGWKQKVALVVFILNPSLFGLYKNRKPNME
jgi:glycosyltransferase involved in cell wall biosynthesis